MTGHLEHLGGNSYRLRVSAGTDGSGRRIRPSKTITASSVREAEKMLALYVAEVDRGIISPSQKFTFSEFVSIWFRDYASNQLAPKTLFRYHQMLDSRIISEFGKIKLEKLTPNHFLQFYNKLRKPNVRMDNHKDRGLASRTILHHHRLIKTILNTAVKWGYLFSNPADRCDSPKTSKQAALTYNEEQTFALLDAAENAPLKYRLLILLAIATGARQGELMGLEWQHVDIENGIIKIEQSAQYIPQRGNFIKAPKNPSSVRTIGVPAIVKDALRIYRREQTSERLALGAQWQAGNLVFVSSTGQPMYPGIMSSWFPQFLRKQGLPPLNFHGLRHTSASLLIANGASAVDLSKRLGHANTTMTMNLYAHSFDNADKGLTEKMEAILSRKSIAPINKSVK